MISSSMFLHIFWIIDSAVPWISFSSGDIVFVKQDGNEFKASIIYGPYEVDKKRLYEAEINDGEVVEIDERFIQEKVE